MRSNPMSWLGSSGSILATVIPHCPLCATASATLLYSLGLGVVVSSGVARWLVPLFLLLGVVGLTVGARQHHRWWPLALGIAASVAVYIGWNFEQQFLVLAGAGTVLFASIVNYRLQRRPSAPLVRIGKGETP
jgi:hypothetical protein